MYQGVRLSPEQLMNEYKARCKEEIERGLGIHSEIKVEEIFAGICKSHASWGIDDMAVGIEAARLFRSASIRRLQAFPQSLRLLEAIKAYPLGIVSNGQRVFSEIELRYFGLDRFFKFVIFSSDLRTKKPNHRIFLAGANSLGLRPEEILFIGDSQENDITPSRQLGMKAMHIEEAWRHFKVA
jgi:putative hydrolase of the HAD superfamily